MSDHKTVFVPIEAWSFSSPEIRRSGNSIDLGLLAEALMYYDQVIVNVANQPQFGKLIQWFLDADAYEEFVTLIDNQTIQIYEYSFATAAVKMPDGKLRPWNIVDPSQSQPNTFVKRYLEHPSVKEIIKDIPRKNKLLSLLENKVIEEKADNFEELISETVQDYHDPRRNALILQALVDEACQISSILDVPKIQTEIKSLGNGEHRINWNISISKIQELLGKENNFSITTPYTAAAISCRTAISAARLQSDLYLGSPMSQLVGDKLYEVERTHMKTAIIIDQLVEKVEFPNIRQLVNSNKLDVKDILEIRKKAKKFRNWLQSESERDRDAIIAYHHEVSKKSGLTNFGNKICRALQVGAPLAGIYVGGKVGQEVGNYVGSVVGSGLSALLTVIEKRNAGWNPIVFGNWLGDRIKKMKS